MAAPHPVAGDNASVEFPLIQIEAGIAATDGDDGITVTVDCAAFEHPFDVFVAVHVYVVTEPVPDFT